MMWSVVANGWIIQRIGYKSGWALWNPMEWARFKLRRFYNETLREARFKVGAGQIAMDDLAGDRNDRPAIYRPVILYFH